MATFAQTPRRRRPRERVAEGGRKLQSAGAAFAVALLALAIGALLNAPGLHKSATIQPEGWKRDAALAVTGPLESLSQALLLDRPRRALKAALGRSDDDDVDTGIALPGSVGEKPSSSPPTPPKRLRFTPAHPLRLWIAGDSLVVVPAESLLREVAGNRAIERVRKVDARIATGLERPDVFNWFTYVREQMRTRKPNAVVVMFGGNDDHNLMTGLPEGTTIGSFGSPSWTAEYRRRVRAVMDLVTQRGAYLVWIGLPISHDKDQTARFDAINAIVQKEAQRRPGRVSYVDTYFFFAGDDGGFAQYVTDDAGRLVKMRADDGVHFERPAGDLIAKEVVRRLEKRFDLRSWRGSASR
jgi:lysophospholipase L1-like esterase